MPQEIEQTVPGSVNLPIIPDKVVDKLHKGQDVPLEEISEAAVEVMEATNADRRKPVHAEDLTPISKSQAASLVSGTPDGKLQKGVLPRAPSTRRVIPAPFRRPSISIQVPWEPKPDWGYCRADDVLSGDIIPDLGRVVSTESRIRYAVAEDVVPVSVWHPVGDEETQAQVLDAAKADYDQLVTSFGSDKVAVGYEVLLTGAGGKVLALDAADEVRVFRIQPEGDSHGEGLPREAGAGG